MDIDALSNFTDRKHRYAADGRKLGTEYFTRVTNLAVPLITGQVINQTYTINTINQNGTAYIDNKEYNTLKGNPALTTLQRVYNAEGYAQNITATTPNYYYYRQDHLGNNREVWLANTKKTVQYTQYYPSGLPWASIASDSTGLQERKYNGKEFVEMHGYDTYDYGARGYYAAMGRFQSVDPLCEKYYSISPYVYCANNPVNRIDPDGREWKEKKDEEIAKQLQQQITSRDKSLAKQEQKIKAQIDKIGNNTKLSAEKRDQQIAKQQGKLEDVQTQRGQLSNLDKGITQLGNSKTSYTFNTVEAGTTATLSSMSDGTVVVNNYGTTGNRAHETTHAIQYDNGLIKFNPLGSNNTLMQNPLGLEIQAYATEYSITNGVVPSSDASSPRTVFGITPKWLYGIKNPNTGIYIYRPENYK